MGRQEMGRGEREEDTKSGQVLHTPFAVRI